MARATRSAAAQEREQPAVPRPKQPTKKRKRVSLAGNDDHPPLKQRNSENGIKEERAADDDEQPLAIRTLPELDLAGDVPIRASDAQKILDILELVDTQGLLDRVFPLPSSNLSEPSTSKSQSGAYSLRTLLRESSQHPLHLLRAAVKNLFPISYNPRSRTASPATQQLRFCNLAQSLLDQASFHSVPLPLDIETILSDVPESLAGGELDPSSRSPPFRRPSHHHQKCRYALMQRFPSGSWWTSLSSDLVPSDEKAITDLQTANAELVAVLPSPSDVDLLSISPPDAKPSSTTLGAYGAKKPPGTKQKLPGPRRVSCGSFLDYGPYASFGPSFEQDGVEVGRWTLGEVYWSWEERKTRWSEERLNSSTDNDQDNISSPVSRSPGASDTHLVDPSLSNGVLADEDSLEGLFSKEQIRLLRDALGNLEIEAAVQELLQRNARALKRLEELQNQRLMKPGGFAPVEQGSEEWETAQGILDSLTVLTSLRPRSSGDDTPPLVPSASALRKLHRTLPTASTSGWNGTLPSTRSTALRDDSTLYIKSTATSVPSNPPAAATPTPTATTPATTAASTQPYPAYPYSYATPYRPGYQYKAPQAYYPNAYTPQTSGQTQASSQYYPSQHYGTPGQQQYAYSWYQYAAPQTPTTTAAAAGATAATTQQAGASQPTPTLPTTYASFFSANAQTPGQRAVANTVLAAGTAGGATKAYAQTGWPAGAAPAGYAPPTALPPHMRSMMSTAQTPAATGTYPTGYGSAGYYGAYQATPSPAQS
ncbi:hypothetical protein EDD17DRAFT_892296 [Pisolithus thermaeus]|nr:hypothetical protein EV401DRAFT_1448017 [Pisolithus croceorrhizus]KAI6159513.1 hypothetical protein EDD17DRAFT_892296 [Pisolithus thermaeus]